MPRYAGGAPNKEANINTIPIQSNVKSQTITAKINSPWQFLEVLAIEDETYLTIMDDITFSENESNTTIPEADFEIIMRENQEPLNDKDRKYIVHLGTILKKNNGNLNSKHYYAVFP